MFDATLGLTSGRSRVSEVPVRWEAANARLAAAASSADATAPVFVFSQRPFLRRKVFPLEGETHIGPFAVHITPTVARTVTPSIPVCHDAA